MWLSEAARRAPWWRRASAKFRIARVGLAATSAHPLLHRGNKTKQTRPCVRILQQPASALLGRVSREAKQETIPLGRPVVPLPEGNRYLGFIFARDATPKAVERSLREAHRRLDVDIDD